MSREEHAHGLWIYGWMDVLEPKESEWLLPKSFIKL